MLIVTDSIHTRDQPISTTKKSKAGCVDLVGGSLARRYVDVWIAARKEDLLCPDTSSFEKFSHRTTTDALIFGDKVIPEALAHTL